MSTFTLIVIMSVLMIIGGFALMATPLITFISAGYFIITLFFIYGIFGVIRGISEKRYNKEFIFAAVSLVLGLIGLFVPGAAAMSNYVLLYMAACWFFIHGILTIVSAVENKKSGAETGAVVLGVILGVLELITAVYSAIHPSVMAVSFGILIGLYFVESGIDAIVVGMVKCEGGNNLTVLFTVMGILTIIGGLGMLFTPLLTFLSVGPCIIILFFLNGVLGIVRAISEKRYDKEFYLAIASFILGIFGCVIPGAAAMNNSILLYMAGIWFFAHGIMTIVKAFNSKKKNAGTGVVVIGVVLGVLELLMAAYSVAHPAVLALSLGILIGLYFIESGANMIFIGNAFSEAVAAGREQQKAAARAAK